MAVVPIADPVPNPIPPEADPIIIPQDVISCPVCTYDNDP